MIKVNFLGTNEVGPVYLNLVHIPAGFGVEEFWMSETPVTLLQWWEVMDGSIRDMTKSDLPKTLVNIEDIQEFLKRLNEKTGKEFRLPTELEWCRAVGVEPERLEDYAVYGGNTLSPVKTKLPNEYGLYDMRGLVFEWMSDGEKYLARGGSWLYYQLLARAVFRSFDRPASRLSDFGFRVLCSRPGGYLKSRTESEE